MADRSHRVPIQQDRLITSLEHVAVRFPKMIETIGPAAAGSTATSASLPPDSAPESGGTNGNGCPTGTTHAHASPSTRRLEPNIPKNSCELHRKSSSEKRG